MSNMSAETFSTCKLLDVRGLRVSFDAVDVLHGVDLTVHCGRIHALIGESGSGKSVLARSILGLAGRGARTTGSIRFLGRELVGLSEREYRAIRGADIGLVVQDAMSALNPMRTIGEQLVETIACRHPDFRSGASRASRSSRADRHDIALELLRTVGITAPEKRMNAYAHQLSGGMRQRVMIALALTGSPRLLLADEPTTALDVVVQRELLQEMRALVQARGMSMLIVTHDLNLARDVADDVSVMYAGHVLEEGPVSDVITRPAHPYTEGLLRAMPAMDGTRGRLIPIKGEIPPSDKLGSGCPFASRCPRVTNACRESLGAMTAVEDGRRRTRCDAALLTASPDAPSCSSRLASLPVQDTEFPFTFFYRLVPLFRTGKIIQFFQLQCLCIAIFGHSPPQNGSNHSQLSNTTDPCKQFLPGQTILIPDKESDKKNQRQANPGIINDFFWMERIMVIQIRTENPSVFTHQREINRSNTQ